MMSYAGHAANMREKTTAYRFLIGNLERKNPLSRPRCK
jgi:hypothetical protein